MQIIQKVFLSLQAIRDGVIEAVLDHESGTMQSKDTSDVYSTRLESIECEEYFLLNEFNGFPFSESRKLLSTRELNSVSTSTTTRLR